MLNGRVKACTFSWESCRSHCVFESLFPGRQLGFSLQPGGPKWDYAENSLAAGAASDSPCVLGSGNQSMETGKVNSLKTSPGYAPTLGSLAFDSQLNMRMFSWETGSNDISAKFTTTLFPEKPKCTPFFLVHLGAAGHSGHPRILHLGGQVGLSIPLLLQSRLPPH